jgi:hypothetical protein
MDGARDFWVGHPPPDILCFGESPFGRFLDHCCFLRRIELSRLPMSTPMGAHFGTKAKNNFPH